MVDKSGKETTDSISCSYLALMKSFINKRSHIMSSIKKLTANDVKKLKERPIDFSDIPELTDSQLQELYPKNWQSRSKDSQITQL